MARSVLSVTLFLFIWHVFRIRPFLDVDVGSRSVIRLKVSCTVVVVVGGVGRVSLQSVSVTSTLEEDCNSRLGLRPILISAALVSDICGSLSVNAFHYFSSERVSE